MSEACAFASASSALLRSSAETPCWRAAATAWPRSTGSALLNQPGIAARSAFSAAALSAAANSASNFASASSSASALAPASEAEASGAAGAAVCSANACDR